MNLAESWFVKGVWSWFYSSSGSKELWAQTFLQCLVFQIVGGFLHWPPYLKMLGKGLQLKTTTLLVFFLVSKVFEKLLNRIVDHLEKCGLFSDFQYGFRSSRSTADLLPVASDIIARAFNRSGTTWAEALDIFKAFDRVWHAGLKS